MKFDFVAIKEKYSKDTESKIFVGNADEIRGLIAGYEEQQKVIEDLTKEIKIANSMIKELKASQRLKAKKAPYEDLDD